LLEMHSCPKKHALPAGGVSITNQMVQRQNGQPPRHLLAATRQMTRNFVYSRFRPWRCYRDIEAANAVLLTSFLHEPNKMLIGLESGAVRLYNMTTHEPAETFDCYSRPINELWVHPCATSKLFLAADGRTSDLWDVTKPGADAVHSFTGLTGAVFDRQGKRLAGFAEGCVAIYDVSTGTLMSKLASQARQRGSQYKFPSIDFSPMNDILLADGCLWDPRNESIIQRFDKLGSWGYGIFHANGYEVLLDGAVWDLRTSKLLRIIPALDQCVAKFSAFGDVLFTYKPPLDDDTISNKRRQDLTSFRVLDSLEYKQIHHQEVERQIYHISVDVHNYYISVVESGSTLSSGASNDAVCRLYEIGRQRPNEADSDIDDAHTDSDDEEWTEDDNEGNGIEFNQWSDESSSTEENKEDDSDEGSNEELDAADDGSQSSSHSNAVNLSWIHDPLAEILLNSRGNTEDNEDSGADEEFNNRDDDSEDDSSDEESDISQLQNY